MRPLVLASSSPRRRQLLEQAGVALCVRGAEVDESPRAAEAARDYALRLADDKARAAPAAPAELVLAADTVVHIGAVLYGKPTDAADARRMLGELSDRWHEVTTAFALYRDGQCLEQLAVTTRVRFRALADHDLERYLASGEPLDKAGAYGIQGLGGGLVDRVEGSYTNVVGLPLPEVLAALRRHDDNGGRGG